jgi:hypothetical protein
MALMATAETPTTAVAAEVTFMNPRRFIFVFSPLADGAVEFWVDEPTARFEEALEPFAFLEETAKESFRSPFLDFI